MRFAIWCAVSTAKQVAPDKDSLSEQEKKSRAAGEWRGWVESCGPYIVPGASRSFYVDLSRAENDIPELHAMLEDARADRFDVLIIPSYDRLGDLADMIAQSLRFYNKQLFSVSQPVEPQAAENYDPYAAEAEAIMRDAHRITQRFRINDLQRKRRNMMPGRVERGLTPLRPPFGYKWVGKKEPPTLDEQKKNLLVTMKDMFLSGETVAEILRYAEGTGIAAPNGGRIWRDSSIRYILANPYYAGFTIIQKFKVVRDPRQGKRVRQIKLPRSKWKIEHGRHTAIWDEATHKLLVDELERRKQMFIHHKVRYPLAGLLYCGECRSKLHRTQHGHGKSRRFLWVCSSGHSAHVAILYDEGVDLVLGQLTINKVEPKKPMDESKYRQAIADLQSRRKTIQDGYEMGGYDKVEFSKKIAEIENQIDDLKGGIEKSQQQQQLRERFLKREGKMRRFPEYLKTKPAAYVNLLLRSFYKMIVIHPDRTVEFIEWE